jgi:hypothetical protein
MKLVVCVPKAKLPNELNRPSWALRLQQLGNGYWACLAKTRTEQSSGVVSFEISKKWW